MPEQPDRAQGERVQARPHFAVAYRFCPARASSAGSRLQSSVKSMFTFGFYASLKIFKTRLFFVMMSEKDAKELQLTD